MYPAKDLEDEILSAACKTEDLTVPQLIDIVLKSIGDDGPSKKTVRTAINYLADGGFFLQEAIAIHPTSKARREVARCQEDV
jgi:predicted transcriptional regulator